jgi:hypothetical protein
MEIIHIYRNVADTRNAALALGAIIAADKGVPNKVVEIPGGHRVETEDGKAVDFLGK